MASLPSAENRGGHAMTRYLKWSHVEQSIARKAFDCAVDREFEAVIRNTKEMAGKIKRGESWEQAFTRTNSR
jgi:hypothetical protein